MSRRAAALSCILLIPSLLMADVTLTYKVETKVSPALPASLMQALSASSIVTAPTDRKIAIKGGKTWASMGAFDVISDPANDKVTILDPTGKHYATVPASQYADQIAASVPKIPAALQSMMSSLKLTTDSKLTGQTAEIQGVQAEERQIVLSVGLAMGANAPTTPVMRLVMSLWMAKPEDVAHNPALQEFVASGFQKVGGMNPMESIQKILGQFPGIGDSLGSYIKEIADTHSVTMRMHAEVFMPILAMLAQRAPAGNNTAGNSDPNAAVMVMNEELAEISAAPVADSVFQIPEGYTEAPLADVLSAMVKPAAVGRPATPAGPSENGVTPPVNH